MDSSNDHSRLVLADVLTANSKNIIQKLTLRKKKTGSTEKHQKLELGLTRSRGMCKSNKGVRTEDLDSLVKGRGPGEKENQKAKLQKVATRELYLFSEDADRQSQNQSKLMTGWFNQSVDIMNKKAAMRTKERIYTAKSVQRRKTTSNTTDICAPQGLRQFPSYWQLSSQQKFFDLARQEAILNMRQSILKDLRFRKKTYRSNLFDLLSEARQNPNIYQSNR